MKTTSTSSMPCTDDTDLTYMYRKTASQTAFLLLIVSISFVMLVAASGLVWLTSSFIQGRVHRDTDTPNLTRCRIVSTDPDPG